MNIVHQQQFQRVLTALDHLYLIAFCFEIEAQPFGQMPLVFDDQNAFHRATGSCKHERASAALPLALGPNAPSVPLRHRADDVQPETGPFQARRGKSGHAIKALEDSFQLGFRDADPTVFHADRDVSPLQFLKSQPPHLYCCRNT